MPNLTQLRLAAREMFDEVLRAVDAGKAVRRALHREGSQLIIEDAIIDLGRRPIYSIAIGKAALPMALALEDVISERFIGGLVVGPAPTPLTFSTETRVRPSLWQRCEGGHPLPTKTSLVAAEQAFALIDRANKEHALLIFLISGGGSAMLADLRAASKVLVTCGASIIEINSVRRAFSAVKGGKLAACAPHCDQITLIVSDVPSDQERNVASGPSLEPRDAPDPRDVVARYDLRPRLPPSIIQAIDNTQHLDLNSDAMRDYFVLLTNDDALEAAAQAAHRRGFITQIAANVSDQEIEEGCEQLRKQMEELRAKHQDVDRIACLISGGEFACPVRGDGVGGRNLETALRLACSTYFGSSDAALCVGTDGIDGNSPAAGALVDSTSFERARTIGLDANDFLRRSDSYSFFVALGDVITTGPTGTNVRDVRIWLSPVQNRSR
jgi:glycerate 2-kinase